MTTVYLGRELHDHEYLAVRLSFFFVKSIILVKDFQKTFKRLIFGLPFMIVTFEISFQRATFSGTRLKLSTLYLASSGGKKRNPVKSVSLSGSCIKKENNKIRSHKSCSVCGKWRANPLVFACKSLWVLIVAITQTCSGDLMTPSTHSVLHNCSINCNSPPKDPATIPNLKF